MCLCVFQKISLQGPMLVGLRIGSDVDLEYIDPDLVTRPDRSQCHAVGSLRPAEIQTFPKPEFCPIVQSIAINNFMDRSPS